jgi:hypothetical protein
MAMHALPTSPPPRARAGWPAAFAVVVLASCSSGSSLEPVEGQVLHKGQPVQGALVTFHPKDGDDIKAQRPTGQTREDGRFTLTTGQTAGAPAGEYVVTVIWMKEVEPPGGKKTFSTGGADPVDQLQGRYADYKRSKLTAQITKGKNQLEPFRLD